MDIQSWSVPKKVTIYKTHLSQDPEGVFDHFKSLKLSPGHELWAHWGPKSSMVLPSCSRHSQS